MTRRTSTGVARRFCKFAWRQTYGRANGKGRSMKRICMALAALALVLAAFLAPTRASAKDKRVVSMWGGSWRDMVDNLIGKKFTAATGVPVEYITGGTIDRLNKEKLAKGNPERDITFTTSHVGWLYANDGSPVQLILSMNAHYMAGEGVPIQLVIPKEGAVLGIDTVAIMKGSMKA